MSMPVIAALIDASQKKNAGSIIAQTYRLDISEASKANAWTQANADGVLGYFFMAMGAQGLAGVRTSSDFFGASDAAYQAILDASGTEASTVFYSELNDDLIAFGDDYEKVCAWAGTPSGSFASWADVAASSTAMDAVAASSTAMDAVVASSTACAAIAASATAITALDNSSPILVPEMTSNTEPSGVASAGSVHSTYYAWNGFDGSTSTVWGASTTKSTWWLSYEFTSSVWCYKVILDAANTAYPQFATNTFKIQYMNASSEWVDATSTLTAHNNNLTPQEFIVSAPTGKVSKWRLLVLSCYSSNQRPNVRQLQFYCK